MAWQSTSSALRSQRFKSLASTTTPLPTMSPDSSRSYPGITIDYPVWESTSRYSFVARWMTCGSGRRILACTSVGT